ncbi:unnamed protein product [Menidia menidia]|uniref:(Atlantic silverside) hypothetical protein n=1 Tax=Menidia menidia TaxID=238744 RepID=A0A8S4BCA0_9TELE|nr:unnamed protein product [Menidia menidia]
MIPKLIHYCGSSLDGSSDFHLVDWKPDIILIARQAIDLTGLLRTGVWSCEAGCFCVYHLFPGGLSLVARDRVWSELRVSLALQGLHKLLLPYRICGGRGDCLFAYTHQ